MVESRDSGAVAFALVYLTFFLDNVLLTVLVPIMPDWIHEDSLQLWSQHGTPLSTLLNDTLHRSTAADDESNGRAQALVGLVLGVKAGAQLLAAGPAGAAVGARGPAAVLRAATALLAAAALVFAACSSWRGAAAAWSVALARAAHGAGAALGGVAGLSLVAASPARPRALATLLGAVALGVLVGYPFGGITYALWSRGASFIFIAALLLANLAMQFMFLNKPEYNMPSSEGPVGGLDMLQMARRECVGPCAGAVLLTTSAMAALEPCLPLWISHRFHPKKWALGAVFVADSAGYLAGTVLGALGGGAERLALGAQLAVGLAALALGGARSLGALAAPQAALGLGLGALDAALLPALARRHRARVHLLAALLQAASSAAYTLGPVLGGALSWAVGFESTMRALGVLNVLYVGHLYRALRRHPLSEQWGATTPEDSSEDISEVKGCELTPLRPQTSSALQQPLH